MRPLTAAEIDILSNVWVRASNLSGENLLELSSAELNLATAEFLVLEEQLLKLRIIFAETVYGIIPKLGPQDRSTAIKIKRQVTNTFDPIEWNVRFLTDFPETFTHYQAWQAKSKSYADKKRSVQAAYERALEDSRKVIVRLIDNPIILEGLILSSHNLYDAAKRYVRDGQKLSPKSRRQFERSFIEHLARTCTKTTPRGVLVGLGLATWSEDGANIEKSRAEDFIKKRVTLLNMSICRRLAQNISRDENVWPLIRPRLNNTYFPDKDKVWFWKADPKSKRDYLFALPLTSPVIEFIEAIEPRTKSAQEIIDTVARSTGFSHDQILNYYQKIAEKGLILSDLEIPFEYRDGIEFIQTWLNSLPEAKRPEKWVKLINEIRSTLRDLDRLDLTWPRREETYQNLHSLIEHLIPEIVGEVFTEKTISVDSISKFDSIQLPATIRSSIQSALEACYRLTAANNGRMHNQKNLGLILNKLDIDFDEQTPLWRVINAGQKPQPPKPASSAAKPAPRPFEDWFLSKVDQTAKIVDLKNPRFFAGLPNSEIESPAGATLFEFQLVADSAEALSRGDFLIVFESNPNNLSSTYSRYMKLFGSSEIRAELEAHFEQYKNALRPDHIWADVAILPMTFTDTALSFEPINSKIIEAHGTRSEKPADKIIPLHQIYFSISKNGEAKLFWKKGNESIPLQPNFLSQIEINPKDYFNEVLKKSSWAFAPSAKSWLTERITFQKHLPRLVYGNVVINREMWTFAPAELKFSGAPSELFIEWNRWRQRQEMPRFVFARLDEGKPFYVDFLSPHSVENLDHAAKSIKLRATFTEMLPTPQQQWSKEVPVQFQVGVQWTRVL